MKPLETLSDLAALAKAGFSAADIKELMAAEKETPKEDPEILPKEEKLPEDQTAQVEPVNPSTEIEPNYKAVFEKQQAELEQLKADLAKAQAANTTKDVSKDVPDLSGQDLVNKIFSEVIY